MLKSKAFVRQTRTGRVVRVVREHYLRDDLSCGYPPCSSCPAEPVPRPQLRELPPSGQFIVIDTNIALHQMDLLEHPAIHDLIILQTVLQETKANNIGLYDRLRALCADSSRHFYVFVNEHHRDCYVQAEDGESPNDRNDRAIREATTWYFTHLSSHRRSVILLSDDRANRHRAQRDGLTALSTEEYVTKHLTSHPELLDVVVRPGAATEGGGEEPGEGGALYDRHLSATEINAGLKAGRLMQGVFRRVPGNPKEGFLIKRGRVEARVMGGEEEVVEAGDEVLLVGLRNMNRACAGDMVVVELLPQGEWRRPEERVAETRGEGEDEEEEEEEEAPAPGRSGGGGGGGGREPRPTGKVVGILKRNWRQYGGFLKYREGRQTQLFCPMDKSMPYIKIETRQGAMLKGKRLVVAPDRWPINSRYPWGHYVRTIGEIGDRVTESELVLLESDVPHGEFTQDVLKCVPQPGWQVTPEEVARRRDLRQTHVMSIDPPGCTDIDDALHWRLLENGNVEVGVHIADVSHFIQPGSPLDREAQNRATSVYLVEKRIDMIPPRLSTDLCSLHCKVDRLAFSVLWEINPTADLTIVSSWFGRTVIHSRASLSYQEAQDIMDDASQRDTAALAIRGLNFLAQKLRLRRLAAGALTLSSPEVKFSLDVEQDPTDVEMYAHMDTHVLVEEFMLLANIEVARKIHRSYPNCAVLRRHPAPLAERLQSLQKLSQAAGFTLDVTSSKTLADSLDLAVRPETPFFNELLRILTTRCMQQAVYFSSGSVPPEEFRHYGLAVDIYTHFTSPIRRYSDLLVHRLLAAITENAPLPAELLDNTRTSRVCDHLNYRTRMAQQASRASTQLYAVYFFRKRILLEQAYVTRVRANGVFVLVPRFGVEGVAYLDAPAEGSPPCPSYVFDAASDRLVAGGSSALAVFDAVWVELSVEADQQMSNQFRLRLFHGEPSAAIRQRFKDDSGGRIALDPAVVAEINAQREGVVISDATGAPSGGGGGGSPKNKRRRKK